jgi:protein SCO1
MILSLVGFTSLALAAVAAVQLGRTSPVTFNGTPYPDAPIAPAFTLIDHTGNSASLEDYRGRAVLLFFGFTECPDVCPITLSKLDRLIREEDIPEDELAVLMVSVEPETDTAERLADYVTAIGPSITGLTGTREEIEAVLGQYGAYAEPSSDHEGRPMIAHTALIFGIDPAGRLQVLLHGEDPDRELIEDIEKLVRLRT